MIFMKLCIYSRPDDVGSDMQVKSLHVAAFLWTCCNKQQERHARHTNSPDSERPHPLNTAALLRIHCNLLKTSRFSY